VAHDENSEASHFLKDEAFSLQTVPLPAVAARGLSNAQRGSMFMLSLSHLDVHMALASNAVQLQIRVEDM